MRVARIKYANRSKIIFPLVGGTGIDPLRSQSHWITINVKIE